MKITSLIENTSRLGYPVEHGLGLLIHRNNGVRVLFDMGQTDLFAQNAHRMGHDVADVDVAVISHGHYDHGGGLGTFLKYNEKARIYVHRDAFAPHYSLKETGLRYIGIDAMLQDNERIVKCQDTMKIDDTMTLFSAVQGNCCSPEGNQLLFGSDKIHNDDFCHEQNLLIEEDGLSVLFAGCAHRGIVNIMRKAVQVMGHAPSHVFTGMHLVNAKDEMVKMLARHLMQYTECKFYTMHCTGTSQYEKLKDIMGEQIDYLSCGDMADLSIR